MLKIILTLQMMCDPQGHTYSISTDPTGLWISRTHGGYDATIKLQNIRINGDVILFNNGVMIMDSTRISYLRYGNQTYSDCSTATNRP